MKKEESLLESENVEITENDSETRLELFRLRGGHRLCQLSDKLA